MAVIVGKQAGTKLDDRNAGFSSDIFEGAGCQVLAVRVSDELANSGRRILVPCAGGRHSRRALKLAEAPCDGGTVAFQMRAEADELGHRHLETVIKRAALMILATAIAGMGLWVNSGEVVIGAMLVAPLMMPLFPGLRPRIALRGRS
ncbi:MAG: hypothetical protein ACJAVK_003383 [Akkermansiaceae bacterium]|jgi:hypothetical protein